MEAPSTVAEERAQVLQALETVKATLSKMSDMAKANEDRRAALDDILTKMDQQLAVMIAARDVDGTVLDYLKTSILPLTIDLQKTLADFREAVRNDFHNMRQYVDKFRASFMSKAEGLQDSLNLLRSDVRTNWTTADYAISNSRNVRDENAKLLDMIAAIQRQHNLLATQVDDLRRKHDEGDKLEE